MSVKSYTQDQIISVLYKCRFQNYKVNRLLKAWEKNKNDPSFQLHFNGHTISCSAPIGKNSTIRSIAINLDSLSTCKKCPTLSRIIHNLKGKTYKRNYLKRIKLLVLSSPAFSLQTKSRGVSKSGEDLSLGKLKFQFPEIRENLKITLTTLIDTQSLIYYDIFEYEKNYDHPILRCNNRGKLLGPVQPFKVKIKIPNCGEIFDKLNQTTHKYGIDKKGFTKIKNQILTLARDLSAGNIYDKQREEIEALKEQILQLRNHFAHKTTDIKDFILWDCDEVLISCNELLDHELKIVAEFENTTKELLQSFDEKNKPYLLCDISCTPQPNKPTTNFKLNEESTIALDRENLKYHLLVFASGDIEPSDEIIDFSDFNLTNEEVDLLILYFTKGLTTKDLYALTEEKLLIVFDFALASGMPLLEAMLGKEIGQRVFNEPWKDDEDNIHDRTWENGHLLRDRQLKDDPLKPILALIK